MKSLIKEWKRNTNPLKVVISCEDTKIDIQIENATDEDADLVKLGKVGFLLQQGTLKPLFAERIRQIVGESKAARSFEVWNNYNAKSQAIKTQSQVSNLTYIKPSELFNKIATIAGENR